jgi:glutamyl-tRNA synthetase
MRAMPIDALETALMDFLEHTRPDAFAAALGRRAKLREALPFLKERAQTLADLADHLRFLLQSAPIAFEPKARQALNPDAVARLNRLAVRFEALADWSPAALKAALDAAAQAEGVGFGMIGGPLRAAVTGGAPAPDLTVVLGLLGREETLERLRDACGGAAAS